MRKKSNIYEILNFLYSIGIFYDHNTLYLVDMDVFPFWNDVKKKYGFIEQLKIKTIGDFIYKCPAIDATLVAIKNAIEDYCEERFINGKTPDIR